MTNETTMPAPRLLPSRRELESAFAARDAAYDGLFFVAVRTTGIFCRPSCSSRPRLENIEFFAAPDECLEAGYRPCLRCRPLESGGREPEWVGRLRERVSREPERAVRAEELMAMGLTPERVRRWFQQHFGMTFARWCREQRLARALTALQSGGTVDGSVVDAGYESHSGFREAFHGAFGAAPASMKHGGDVVRLERWETPVGPVVAGATDRGLCVLEYQDEGRSRATPEALSRVLRLPVVAGPHPWLVQAKAELAEYFSGKRREFTVPLAPRGTEFQLGVWRELGRIPFATTICYEELAVRLGKPTACRAVAQANGVNRLAIVIPCHRVVGKDGSLTGYGGGLWRKRLLLELERSGRLPG